MIVKKPKFFDLCKTGRATEVAEAIRAGEDPVARDREGRTALMWAAMFNGPKVASTLLEAGVNVLLDIEVQGARQVNEKMPEAVKIFIIPPTLEELRRRLEGRGTDTARAIEARLIRARQEYEEADFYDYIIVNDDADTAAQELAAIITAEHCRAAERIHYLKNV